MDTADDWEHFFGSNPKPLGFNDSAEKIEHFVQFHKDADRKIVLVTSGGTIIPLEHNTVRFVDNFSQGRRGAISSEWFLKRGYAVIFLFRTNSVEPLVRLITPSSILDSLSKCTALDGTVTLKIVPEKTATYESILDRYNGTKRNNTLLSVSFKTLSDYLWLLRTASQSLNQIGRNAMLFLAAAVSDFYVPPSKMSLHKIKSDEALTVNLELVPKMLKPLVKHWAPNAFTISFKLETDELLLINKARKALESYGHQIVVANVLHTIRTRVVLVTRTGEDAVETIDDGGVEIEELIVGKLVERHEQFVSEV